MIFKYRDLHMFYRTEGEGTPILFLHGWPTDHQIMVGAFEPIFRERAGYERIYVDLPGMGETTGGSWLDGNDGVLEVLVEFVQEVIGKRPFLLAGLSYGGYLARGLLHRLSEQIEGMLLLVPVVGGNREERTLPPRRVIVSNPDGFGRFPEPFGAFFASLLVVQEEAIIERQFEVLDGLTKADETTLARISTNSRFSFDVDALPEPFEKPVLILSGRHDSVTGYEDPFPLVHLYPRASYAVLDRAGHGLHMEQEPLFTLFVQEWLDRVEEC